MYSQAPTIEWQKVYGGISSENLRSIQKTLDGGSVLSGTTLSVSSGDVTENNIWGFAYDLWIVKLNILGTIEWQKRIGGTGADSQAKIKQTSDNGYIISCESNSNISGYKTENSKGGWDYWIIKLNNNGVVIWDKTIGGSGDDFASSLDITNDGNILIGGSSNSPISGDKTSNARGYRDFWLVKLDNQGTLIWDKTIGGSNGEVLNSMIKTLDNGYILAGSSNSNISWEKTEIAWDVDSDFWVVKIDSFGNVIWDKTLGGTSIDETYDVVLSDDGGYVFAGNSNSGISGNKTQSSNGSFDIWVVKLNFSGNIEWQKNIGGNQIDGCYSILNSLDDGYVILGWSNSNISGDKSENSRGNYDFWIIKINSLGNILWQKTYGGMNRDLGFGITQINDGSYLIAGETESSQSGEITDLNNGNIDFCLFKLSPENLSTNINQISNSIWIKNPIKNSLEINTNYAIQNASIKVTDMLGKELFSTTNVSINGSLEIPVFLSNGVYLVTISNDGDSVTKKIVKE